MLSDSGTTSARGAVVPYTHPSSTATGDLPLTYSLMPETLGVGWTWLEPGPKFPVGWSKQLDQLLHIVVDLPVEKPGVPPVLIQVMDDHFGLETCDLGIPKK